MEPVIDITTNHRPIRAWKTYGGIAWRCVCGQLNSGKLPSDMTCSAEDRQTTQRERVLRNVSAK